MQMHKFFAGSNSSQGFYSFFDQIIKPETQLVYYLKGGPGTGKSYFMHEISRSFAHKPLLQELFYCSSDPNSLDALALPELGLVFVDATKPHALEPNWPGSRDELICLNSFWNGEKLREKRDEIMQQSRKKETCFKLAFQYLAATRALEKSIELRNASWAEGYAWQLDEIQELILKSGKNKGFKQGNVRHLFSSAITPEGYVSLLPDLIAKYEQRYILIGPPGTGKDHELRALANFASYLGYDLEVFHDPLTPTKFLHLLLPELGLAILSATWQDPLTELVGKRIRFGKNSTKQGGNQRDWLSMEQLFTRAIGALKQAKAEHAKLEDFFAIAMDFAALTEFRKQIESKTLNALGLN